MHQTGTFELKDALPTELQCRGQQRLLYYMSSDILVPELQGDVHGVGSLVSGKLDEALLVLEGHRHRHEVEGAALHHAADVL